MALATVLSPMPNSFVYEDLVSQVQTIQKQMIEMENILDNQWITNKKQQNELKSRSVTFLDHMGYRTSQNCMDHEQISKVARKYKKNYIPKYLHEWIKFGIMNENFIASLTDLQLKSAVANYGNGQEFISHGEIIVWVGTYEDSWPRQIVVGVLLTDNMEKIKMEIRKQRQFTGIELKSCMIDENVKPNEKNWSEGTPLKSDDTILSSHLFQKNCVIMGKVINKKVKYYFFFP
jgi:hypothetical protein